MGTFMHQNCCPQFSAHMGGVVLLFLPRSFVWVSTEPAHLTILTITYFTAPLSIIMSLLQQSKDPIGTRLQKRKADDVDKSLPSNATKKEVTKQRSNAQKARREPTATTTRQNQARPAFRNNRPANSKQNITTKDMEHLNELLQKASVPENILSFLNAQVNSNTKSSQPPAGGRVGTKRSTIRPQTSSGGTRKAQTRTSARLSK